MTSVKEENFSNPRCRKTDRSQDQAFPPYANTNTSTGKEFQEPSSERTVRPYVTFCQWQGVWVAILVVDMKSLPSSTKLMLNCIRRDWHWFWRWPWQHILDHTSCKNMPATHPLDGHNQSQVSLQLISSLLKIVNAVHSKNLYTTIKANLRQKGHNSVNGELKHTVRMLH